MTSVEFPDIFRVKTIKDRRIQIMPPHDNHNPSLREMHALLQEMKTINDDVLHAQHDLDHLEWNPFTAASKAYKDHKDNKASKADTWNQITTKWETLSLKTKREILKYVVEHDVKDAWTCFLKVMSDISFKTITADDQKKIKMNEAIDREETSTQETIKNIFTAFAKIETLKSVIITKVRDTVLPGDSEAQKSE